MRKLSLNWLAFTDDQKESQYRSSVSTPHRRYGHQRHRFGGPRCRLETGQIRFWRGPFLEPGALQSGFRVTLRGPANFRKIAGEFSANLVANVLREFFGLIFPGFPAHAQNSRPELSALLSNFIFSLSTFFTRFSACWGDQSFKTPSSVSFLPSPNFGERTQWVPLSLLFVWKQELSQFFAELTDVPQNSVSSILLNSTLETIPKAPSRTKNTAATQNIVNFYAEAFALRPPTFTTPLTPL